METETKEAAAGCPGLMDEKKDPQHAGGMKNRTWLHKPCCQRVHVGTVFFYVHLLMEHIPIPLN